MLGGDRRELLEHPRPEAAALLGGEHRERDLGRAQLAQALVPGDRDDLALAMGEQRDAVLAVGGGVVGGDAVGADVAVEAQVPALGIEPVEEVLDRRLVVRRRLAQPQDAAVAQDDVADEGHRPHSVGGGQASVPACSRSRSSMRRIFPVSVFGRSSTNSTRRG